MHPVSLPELMVNPLCAPLSYFVLSHPRARLMAGSSYKETSTKPQVGTSIAGESNPESFSFYIGPADKEKVIAVLADKEDGAFLLRASVTTPGTYVLGVKYGSIHHVVISQDKVCDCGPK